MWQPPGGLSDPPEVDDEQETSSGEQPLSTSESSKEHSNSQFAGSRKRLENASGTRNARSAILRKRTSRTAGSGRLTSGLRQANSSQNNLSQHGSPTWTLKHRRCTDQPTKRHFRMANLYDIQYSSSNILNSIPTEVRSNANNEEVSNRLLSKRLQDPISNQQTSEDQSDSLAMWPLKDAFSNCNDHFNMISSFSSPELLTPGLTQCPSSDVSTEPIMPGRFNTRLSNITSISEHSSAINSNSISCSNPSTSIGSSGSVSGNVNNGVLANTDYLGNDTGTNITSVKLYGSERSFSRRVTSVNQNEVVLFEVHKLHGHSNLNLPPATVQARKVANRVIMQTRIYKTPDERSIWCSNCDRIPTLPVTGQCGHTRCSKCVKENETCPCGSPPPRSPCVNTVIQAIIDKMLQHAYGTRIIVNSAIHKNEKYRKKNTSASASISVCTRRITTCPRSLRYASGFNSDEKYISSAGTYEGHMPMTPQGRLQRARVLLARGQYRAAAPHLARVAASGAPSARRARLLLAQAISALSQSCDPRRLTRELHRAVRLQSAVSWLKAADLECVLCYHTYTSPVTTPCGHTYCRTCIERSLDYRKTCALCLRPLDDFNLSATRETEFVSAALAAIGAVSPPAPPDPDVIPIFVCTVAFPSIPCPLFIFDPRYWLMIRRILESGSRKFGMVAYERDRSYSDYGTVLEVCDCVHLEDGRSILSTVGVSRFRVIERDVRDGCDVARIQPLVDAPAGERAVWELRVMAAQISYKALVWLGGMNRAVRAEIEAAFGPVPRFRTADECWERADGPQWLWWLVAILPLRSEIKILILSTRSLLKRMMAVARTLEVMDTVAFTNNSNTECDLGTALSSTEDWLERNA